MKIAVGTQVGGDGPAQARVAEGLTVTHHLITAAPPVLGGQTRPLRHRERIKGGQRRGEGAGDGGQALTLAEELERALGGLRQPRCTGFGASGGGGRHGPGCFKSSGHIGARADPRLDQPLGGQAVKGFDHGGA
jgi:hypothetical protein